MKEKGFSLIELVITITLIAVISALTAPLLANLVEQKLLSKQYAKDSIAVVLVMENLSSHISNADEVQKNEQSLYFIYEDEDNEEVNTVVFQEENGRIVKENETSTYPVTASKNYSWELSLEDEFLELEFDALGITYKTGFNLR